MYSKFIFQLLLSLVIGFSASNAYSCNCDKPTEPKEVKNAAQIFKGLIVKITPLRTEYREGETVIVTFRILEMISGAPAKETEVEFMNAGFSSCDLEKISFQLGDVYLISTFEYSKPKGKYFNNYCCLRQKLDSTGAKGKDTYPANIE